MIRKIFLLFIFLFFSFWTYSQKSTVDSLQTVLLTQKDDTSKVNTLNALANAITSSNDEIYQIANKALMLSEKINFNKGKGLAYFIMGKASHNYAHYHEALKNFSAALKIRQELGDKHGTAVSYDWIGFTYNSMGDYSDALINFTEALKLYEELGEKRNAAHALQVISVAYSFQRNYNEALKGNLAALKMMEELRDSLGIASSHLGIGEIYSEQSNYTEALKEFDAAIKSYGQTGKDVFILVVNMKIGKVYEKQGDMALASGDKITSKIKFLEALEKYLPHSRFSEKNEDLLGMIESYNDLGVINIKLNNLSLAKKYLQYGLQYSRYIGSKHYLVDNYKNLAQLDSSLGTFKQAYEDYKLYILYRDSLNNDEAAKTALQTQFQYDFDKKETILKAEQEKKDAETRRARNLQYSVIGAFVLLAVFLFWNNRLKQKAKRKVEKAYKELKSTQAQLIQSEKMASLGELTAGIAHEIQNPLNFVNNFSDVNTELISEMKQEIDKGNMDEVKAIANDIEENEQKISHHGKRADAIVKGMLQHSRHESGVKEPTDINKLADEYLRLSYHGLRAKDKSFNATMKTDFDEAIGKINIIPQDIGRVILNLINNAFYATDEKKKSPHPLKGGEEYEPVVTVSTKRLGSPLGDGGKIEIRVADNGNGIPQKILGKIFQPFFTTKPTGQGTGLGLSLAYDIVKAHGGEIKVKSVENEETEFVINLPV